MWTVPTALPLCEYDQWDVGHKMGMCNDMKRLMILALALVPIGVVSLWELSDAATTDTAAASVDRTTALVGEPVVFTSTNPCTTACSLTWRRPDIGLVRFGGVIVGRGEQITLSFALPGSYQVVLDLGETCDGTTQLVCHSYAAVFVDITGAPQPDPVARTRGRTTRGRTTRGRTTRGRTTRGRTTRGRTTRGRTTRGRTTRGRTTRGRTDPRPHHPRPHHPRPHHPRPHHPRPHHPRPHHPSPSSAGTRRGTRTDDAATGRTQRPEHHHRGWKNPSHVVQPGEFGNLTRPRALQRHRLHQLPPGRRADHVDDQLHRVSYPTRNHSRHLPACRLRFDGNRVLEQRGRDRSSLTAVASTISVGSARIASLVSCVSRGRSLSQ